MSPLPAAVRFATNPLQQLVNDINRIVGPQNLRALYIPSPYEGSVVQDKAVPSRLWTHGGTVNGARYTKQGQGWLLSFDGASQYLTTPDANDLSFGNATVDSPFSVFAAANVTDTAAARRLFAKFTSAAQGEYGFSVNAADSLALTLIDASSNGAPNVSSTSAISQGVLSSLAATYSAATGGATAGNDVALYQNGAALATTVSNTAAYIAMENSADVAGIASGNPAPTLPYPGQLGLILVAAIALTAAQVADLDRRCRRFLGY